MCYFAMHNTFFFCRSNQTRGKEGRRLKNQKTKIRQKKAKKFASTLMLAEKDNMIENLKVQL